MADDERLVAFEESVDAFFRWLVDLLAFVALLVMIVLALLVGGAVLCGLLYLLGGK